MCALWLSGCGGAPPAPVAHVRPRDADAAAERVEVSAGARHLAPGATFADLARAIGEQDRLRDSDSDAGCLLRRRGDAFDVAADLAVAIRPLPPVDVDLDARMESLGGPIRVLTRYGSYGDAPTGATALTTTAPAPEGAIATVLVMTDRGVYVRSSAGQPVQLGAYVPSAALAAIDPAGAVFVTAEAGVPVAEVAALLGRLPPSFDGRMGLAVLLPPETALPPPTPAEPAVGPAICVDGLSPLGDEAPEGALSTDRILAGIAPLRSAAEICVGTSTSAGALGGRVLLDVRVGPGGRVSDVCVREDRTDDAALRACLVEATRNLGFDDPHGVIDVELPLVLTPGLAHRQRALCDD